MRTTKASLAMRPLAALAGASALAYVLLALTTPAALLETPALRGAARNHSRLEVREMREALAALRSGINELDAPAAPKPVAAASSPTCTFRADSDIRGGDGDEFPREDMDRESCCALCAATPWCAAAALSGEADEPPSACWLKRTAEPLQYKRGVTVCIPSEEAARPPPPPPPPPAESGVTCRFQANQDVAGADLGNEPALVDATPEQCAAACVERDDCAAAALSGPGDNPPAACWLKMSSAGTVRKDGVSLCVVSPPRTPRPVAYDAPAAVSAAELRERREKIKGAIKHAWDGYRRRAFGRDSVAPITGRPVNSGFDMAVTLVDSLDTLWLVGLRDEFREARDFVAQESFGRKLARPPSTASVFETTIRVLGGLLGAYELSRDAIFATRARQIGDAVYAKIDPATGSVPGSFGGRAGPCPSLAHAGTVQLEMLYLSRITNDDKYARRARAFYEFQRRQPNLDGLYPQCVGGRTGKLTLGAEADSFYEYLPKVWLLRGGPAAREAVVESFPDVWKMYDAALKGMEARLISRDARGGLWLDELRWRGGAAFSRDAAMEHLACFVPAWVALGAPYFPEDRARRLREVAHGLGETCWRFYADQPTGISPERIKGRDTSLRRTDTREYILRPEAAEAWFYLSRTPGLEDRRPLYRDWGWRAFAAIDRHLRVAHGHASMKDVRRTAGDNRIDKMESFWLAETLKYFYLLQEDDERPSLPLDRYVFNTEAHPFSVVR